MVFSSCIFLFAFLPIVYLLYIICPDIKLKNGLLILASLLFYAFGEPVYVFLMIGSILANYLLARAIACTRDGLQKLALTITVLVNIGLLVVFKYLPLLISTINAIAHIGLPVPQITLPIGISFYTFQALSYCIDVYRNPDCVQKNLFRVMLYISFFPQLIAGPIVKYHDIDKQLRDRTITWENTSEGIVRFIYGLAKKLLIANQMAFIVDSLYTTNIDMAATAWIVAVCYCLQIYFDFSGYSDMAIGLGKMFGFTFLENFDHPYISSSIQEFWRRWHISLSTWFKEYLYIPLGGNRKGSAITMRNKLIVFACTGIWHGANWTFLLWGLFHGLFISLESKKLIPLKNKVFAHIYTMLVVICGFVIFRADTIGQAFHILKSMFTGFFFEASEWVMIAKLANPYSVLCIVLGLLFSAPVSKVLKQHTWSRYTVAIILFFICIMNLATTTYNPFIYFRF